MELDYQITANTKCNNKKEYQNVSLNFLTLNCGEQDDHKFLALNSGSDLVSGPKWR